MKIFLALLLACSLLPKLAVGQPSLRALGNSAGELSKGQEADNGRCAAELDQLREQSDATTINVNVADRTFAGEKDAVRVEWTRSKVGLRTPMYIVLSVSADVRFFGRGILALSPQAPAPSQLRFGAGQSRAIIPLHNPLVPTHGSFAVTIYSPGPVELHWGVVAQTDCGEQPISAVQEKKLDIGYGPPKVVVQDFYDSGKPTRTVISNSGRYKLHEFGGRYKVFDAENGSLIIERQGHQPNFSPTSRFLTADRGVLDTEDIEIIDLVAGRVIKQVDGAFVQWEHGDSFAVNADVRETVGISAALLDDNPSSIQEISPDDSEREAVWVIDHMGCNACDYAWKAGLKYLINIDVGVAATYNKEEMAGWNSFVGEFDEDGEVSNYPPNQDFETIFRLDPLKGYRAVPSLGNGSLSLAKEKHFTRFVVSHRILRSDNSDAELKITRYATKGDWRAAAAEAAKGWGLETRPVNLAQSFGIEFNETFEISSFTSGAVDIGTIVPKSYSKSLSSVAAAVLGNIDVAREKLRVVKTTEQACSDAQYNAVIERIDELVLGCTFGLWHHERDGKHLLVGQFGYRGGSSGVLNDSIYILWGKRGLPGRWITINGSSEDSPIWAPEASAGYEYPIHEAKLRVFLADNNYLALFDKSNASILVYDLDRERIVGEINRIPGSEILERVHITKDDKHIFQINRDGTLGIYNIEKKRKLLSGRYVDDEMIFFDNNNFYESTFEGGHFVNLRFSGDGGIHTFQQFASKLNQPGLVRRTLAGVPPREPVPINPPPVVSLKLAGSEIQVAAEARAGVSLSQIRIFFDGSPTHIFAASGRTGSYKVAFPQSERVVSAIAIDDEGLVSRPVSVELPPRAGSERTLWVLGVGVNKYERLNQLNFAAADAKLLSQVLASSPQKYYGRVSVRPALINEAATRGRVLQELNQVIDASKPGDTIVFSFSGHGLRSSDGKLFLGASGAQLEDLSNTAVPWTDISEILNRSRARVVVILDACHAGAASPSTITNDESATALLSASRAPIVIFAASKGRQLSLEDPALGAGVFTSAFQRVLGQDRGRFDTNRDGLIGISEMFQATRDLVRQATRAKQSPWLARSDMVGDFPLF